MQMVEVNWSYQLVTTSLLFEMWMSSIELIFRVSIYHVQPGFARGWLNELLILRLFSHLVAGTLGYMVHGEHWVLGNGAHG